MVLPKAAPASPRPALKLPRDFQRPAANRCPASNCGSAMNTDVRRRTAKSVKYSRADHRSEEHTSELQSLMRNSYAVFCLKKKKKQDRRVTSCHNKIKQANDLKK